MRNLTGQITLLYPKFREPDFYDKYVSDEIKQHIFTLDTCPFCGKILPETVDRALAHFDCANLDYPVLYWICPQCYVKCATASDKYRLFFNAQCFNRLCMEYPQLDLGWDYNDKQSHLH